MKNKYLLKYQSEPFIKIVRLIWDGAHVDTYEGQLIENRTLHNERSLELCLEAVEHFPEIAYKLYSTASLLSSLLGDDVKALEYLDNDIEKIPKEHKEANEIVSDLHVHKYFIYKRQGKLDPAFHALTQAEVTKRFLISIYTIKAKLLYEMRTFDEVLRFTELAIHKMNTDDRGHYQGDPFQELHELKRQLYLQKSNTDSTISELLKQEDVVIKGIEQVNETASYMHQIDSITGTHIGCSTCGELTHFNKYFPQMFDEFPFILYYYEYQCQKCGWLKAIGYEYKPDNLQILEERCHCGGEFRRDKHLICSRCKAIYHDVAKWNGSVVGSE